MFHAPLPEWVPTSQPFKPGQHYGIDYASPTGTPVACAEAGFVRYKATEGDGYGNTLTVEHADGWESRYAHLLTFPVNQGDTVGRGQIIATTGGGQGPPGAGFSTGPHLHYELRHHGVATDPAPLLDWGPPPDSDEGNIEMGTPEILNAIAVQTDTLAGYHWDTRGTVIGGVNDPQAQWEWDSRAYFAEAIAEQTAVILEALGAGAVDVAEAVATIRGRLRQIIPDVENPPYTGRRPTTD